MPYRRWQIGSIVALSFAGIAACGESNYSRGAGTGTGGDGTVVGTGGNGIVVTGTGGEPAGGGTGGAMLGTGGFGTAGNGGSVGRGTGGAMVGSGGSGNGGRATGGSGSFGTGGTGTGGSSTGGAGTGGAGTGGSGSGGSSTGGAGTGGSGTGGSGSGGIVATGGTGTGGATAAGPILFYPFDEASGTSVADQSGNMSNGIVSGGGAFAPGMVGNALTFAGGGTTATNTYVTIPAGVLTATRDMTLSVWVRIQTDRTWQRIFDFGRSSTTSYMFLTAHAATVNVMRFAITTAGNNSEQKLDGPALPVGTWKHLAVVLGSGGGSLYVDGAKVATNAAMSLRPADLGTTTNHWLGRSQFSPDPYFAGQLDELRIYDRALSDAEISAVYSLR